MHQEIILTSSNNNTFKFFITTPSIESTKVSVLYNNETSLGLSLSNSNNIEKYVHILFLYLKTHKFKTIEVSYFDIQLSYENPVYFNIQTDSFKTKKNLSQIFNHHIFCIKYFARKNYNCSNSKKLSLFNYLETLSNIHLTNDAKFIYCNSKVRLQFKNYIQSSINCNYAMNKIAKAHALAIRLQHLLKFELNNSTNILNCDFIFLEMILNQALREENIPKESLLYIEVSSLLSKYWLFGIFFFNV